MLKHFSKFKSRIKLWDQFKWGYKSPNYLFKNHSLNCGCSQCRWRTEEKKLYNKRERINGKLDLKDEIVDLD